MTAAERLTACRAAGVAMPSLYAGRHYGWTTDDAAAEQLRELDGVRVAPEYNREGPRGWEISFDRDPD